MNTNTLNVPIDKGTKHNYDVLIEKKGENKVTATVLGWQDCQTEGRNKEEALNKLRQMLTTRLQQTEIVSLEIELPQREHPWIKFAGMYKDNPLFNEVLEDIQIYRKELDAEINEHEHRLDYEED